MTTFIVPVSGGKDSQLVLARTLDMKRQPGDVIRAVHQYTGFDHPLTYRHMRYMERRYKVKIEFTRSPKYDNIQEFVKGAGYFPSSGARGCTKELKLLPFIAWLFREKFTSAPGLAHIYFGMRAAESTSRRESYGDFDPEERHRYSDMSSGASHRKRGLENVTCSLPIVNMSTEAVFAELRARGDRVNELYKRGHSRVGCYPCLLSKREEWELAMQDPVGRDHIKDLVNIERRWRRSPPRDKRTGKPHKLIKIHETRDVEYLFKHKQFPEHQRRGMDDAPGGCGLACEI